jgi:hypothetical protein
MLEPWNPQGSLAGGLGKGRMLMQRKIDSAAGNATFGLNRVDEFFHGKSPKFFRYVECQWIVPASHRRP